MSTRLGLALGLALAAAVAVWWLGASRVALEARVGTEEIAANALYVLVLARALLTSVLAPRSAAVGGYVAGLRAGLPVVSAAWPVVALAWAASDASVARTVAAEMVLLACAVAVPFLGRALARVMRQGPALEATATVLGVGLACAVWHLATRPLPGS